MVWKSWGRRLLLLAALLLCSGAAWAAGDVSLSLTSAPPRISRSASAVFAFQALQSSGWTCGDCTITCKLDGGSASDCGGGSSGNGNGTEVVSYAGLTDGNHTFTACATPRSGSANSTTCASYAWDVDTIPPTASVAADSGFTSSPNVSVLVSFSEPCPGAGGFTCNDTYCNLIVYGPGRVDPSTMEAVVPGLQYSVSVAASPDVVYGRLVIVMGRGFCTDEAGHRFRRTSNSSFTLRFDTRSDSMKITGAIPEKLLQIEGSTRVVEATNDDRDLRVYLSFAEPVMNSSAEILAALTATDAVLTPTNRSTLGNRRFGYIVNKISSTAVVTVACDASSIISRQGTPVYSSEPFTFLYDSQRPSVKLATSTVRTSSRSIPVLIKFEKPVFNFSSSAVQVSGGNLCSFHEASKSIYTMHIQAVDKLVSVQVAENTAQDVAGNLNLASDRLQVRHYSVPESSSIIATIVTVTFVATVIVATLLTLATSSLIASGAMSRPSSYSISEPSRNLLRMACHIQVFALSRWLSINLPVEYYELAKGIEWTIPYIRLPWEGPSADPFVGYSTMPAIAYSELVDRSDVASDPYSPRAMPMQIPAVDGGPVFPTQIPALDGRPLTAMEYRSFFQNQDMKPEAQIIMKLQDLDGWKYFGRNMLWLGVIGGGLILLHLLVLLYMRLRYRGSGTRSYGALVLPRLEIMLAILAMPCIAQASAALIRGTYVIHTSMPLKFDRRSYGVPNYFSWMDGRIGRFRWHCRRAGRRDRAHQRVDGVPGGATAVPVAGDHDGAAAPVQGGAPGRAGVPVVPGARPADAGPWQAGPVDVEGPGPRGPPRETRPAVRGLARPAQVHADTDRRRERGERGGPADHGVGGRERGRGGAAAPEGVRHPEDLLHAHGVREARGTGHRGGRPRVVGAVLAGARRGRAGHRVVPALLPAAEEAVHQEAGAAGGDHRRGQRGVRLRRLPRAHRRE
ncbi:hypothetical protein BRADI_3g46247v3 [Brachypodium distachyon]|uniref:Bacterial Ig-like domain-containing protein n=1 Tax=Brachypodium distachyon TaxID=15368 RepID=A0A0Q3FP88_BRADI|nr:hypothetical protein BRADI_3g46247v3 [Brachypodium distachyon]